MAGARVVRIPGLPDFNTLVGDGWRFSVSQEFVAWWAGTGRQLRMVERGSAPGAVRTARSRRTSKRLPMPVHVDAASTLEMEQYLALIKGAFTLDADTPVTVLGVDGYPDLTMWLALDEDEPEVDIVGARLDYTLQLVAADPYRYAPMVGLPASMGVFTGGGAYRVYDSPDGHRVYTADARGNVVPDPSFEAGVSAWGTSGSTTISHETADPIRGAGSLRRERTSSTSNSYATFFGGSVASGQTFYALLTVRNDSAVAAPLRVLLDTLGQFSTAFDGTLAAGEVRDIEVSHVATETDAMQLWVGQGAGQGVAGDVFVVDDVLLSTEDPQGQFGGPPYRTYQTEDDTSTLPKLLVVDNTGDADSLRYEVQINGPLDALDYEFRNDTTGEALMVDVPLTAAQTLTLQPWRRRALLGSEVVSNRVSGVWPRLVPGENTLRLFAGTLGTGAVATVTEAWSAFR